MSETKRTVEEDPPTTPLPSKRKPTNDPPEEGEDHRQPKKTEISTKIPFATLLDDHLQDDEDDYQDSEEDDFDSEEEEDLEERERTEPNGNVTAAIDKGKGIVNEEDRKGKGKSKVEEDSSSSDDDEDDDDHVIEDDDSDFSDDPLAEVDLNNILPARTRRRAVHPGIHLTNDRDRNATDDQ